MKIESIMTTEPTTCSVRDDLASAAKKMWDDDCGILPVVDGDGLQGVITDRDIAMALTMKGTLASNVRVGEVISGHVFGCSPDDEATDALQVMAEHKVRRLPVLDGEWLVGLVSLNDLVLEAASKAGSQKKPTYAQIVEAMQAICAHRGVPAVA